MRHGRRVAVLALVGCGLLGIAIAGCNATPLPTPPSAIEVMIRQVDGVDDVVRVDGVLDPTIVVGATDVRVTAMPPERCGCDLNDDGACNGDDTTLITACLGRVDCGPADPCAGDADADGDCDGEDLAFLMAELARTDCGLPVRVTTSVDALGGFGPVDVDTFEDATYFIEAITAEEDIFVVALLAVPGDLPMETDPGPDADGDGSPDAIDCAPMDDSVGGRRCP